MSDTSARDERLPHENKAAMNETPAKRGRYGCIAVVGLAVMMLGFGLWYACFRSVPLRISPETTYITEPLTADGKRVDYLRAWEERRYVPGMATDDNGFRMILRAFGVAICENNRDSHRDMCETLDLDPHDPPTHAFRDPFTFLDETGVTYENEEINKKLGHPWTPETIPELDGWVEENNAALDLVGEAVRKPVFCISICNDGEGMLIAILLPAAQSSRNFARGLTARANYRIAVGDIDGAVDDILTCYLLGRHIARDGCTVEYLVGMAIESVAHAVPVAGNPNHPPTEEQLRRLLDGIENLPPWQDLSVLWELERFMVLDIIQQISTGKSKTGVMSEFLGVSDESFLAVTNRMGFNWNIVAETVNAGHDEIAEGSYASKSSGIRPMRWLTVRSRSFELGNMLFDLFTPAIDAIKEACRRNDCVMRLKRMTLALLIYERKHGDLPHDKWQDAVREILGETDPDFFRCPSSNAAPGETTYALAPDRAALIIESEMPVSPNTLVDTENPVPRVAAWHNGGINVACRDGSVRFLDETVSEEDWQALFQPPENPTPEQP